MVPSPQLRCPKCEAIRVDPLGGPCRACGFAPLACRSISRRDWRDPGTSGCPETQEAVARVLDELAQEFRARWEPGTPVAGMISELRTLLMHRNTPGGSEALSYFDSSNIIQVLQDAVDLSDPAPVGNPKEAFLRKHLPERNSLVLDAGCSTGRNFLHIEPGFGGRLGIDVDPVAIRLGRRLWSRRATDPPSLVVGSALSLPVATASCTAVLSCVTLASLPVRAALREVRRVLQEGGRLLLCVESLGFWNEQRDRWPATLKYRVRLWRCWLGRRVMELGFDWQHRPYVRRVLGYPQFTATFLKRVLRESGFIPEVVETLTSYQGQPRILGVLARCAP